MIQDRVCIYSYLISNEKYMGVLLFLNLCVDTATKNAFKSILHQQKYIYTYYWYKT